MSVSIAFRARQEVVSFEGFQNRNELAREEKETRDVTEYHVSRFRLTIKQGRKGLRAPGPWPLKSRAPGLQATINRALGL